MRELDIGEADGAGPEQDDQEVGGDALRKRLWRLTRKKKNGLPARNCMELCDPDVYYMQSIMASIMYNACNACICAQVLQRPPEHLRGLPEGGAERNALMEEFRKANCDKARSSTCHNI